MSYLKKLMLALLALGLSGCITPQPLVKPYPEAPKELMQPAPELKNLPEKTNLVEVSTTITDNYSTYHQVKEQLRALQEWVKRVREESLK